MVPSATAGPGEEAACVTLLSSRASLLTTQLPPLLVADGAYFFP